MVVTCPQTGVSSTDSRFGILARPRSLRSLPSPSQEILAVKLSRPRQETKHEQIIRRAKTKAYDVFVKVGQAASLEELVLPTSFGSESSDAESSCWVWLVNLGENGGFFDEKKREVEQVFLSQDAGSVWVPLVGKVSLTRSSGSRPVR